MNIAEKNVFGTIKAESQTESTEF